MIIVSCDVGIVNLAFVKVSVEEWNIQNIIDAFVVDITKIPCIPTLCTLHHSNTVYDQVEHLLQFYERFFKNVDVVLIERQPICGLVHVEQILYGELRKRFSCQTDLVSPNAMHKWLGITNLDYDQRKAFTTKFATDYLSFNTQFSTRLRKHDMADALCLLLFWLDKKKKLQQKQLEEEKREREREEKEKRVNNALKRITNQEVTIREYFDQFRYGTNSTPILMRSKYFL